MPNQMSRELIHAFDKAAYNRQYYQKNKQYWQDYYETGATKPRSRSGAMDKTPANVYPKTQTPTGQADPKTLRKVANPDLSGGAMYDYKYRVPAYSYKKKQDPNSILKPGELSTSKTKGNKKENKYAKKLLSIQKDGHGSKSKEVSNKNVLISKQKSKNDKSSVKKVVDSVTKKVTKTASKAAKKTAKFLKKIFG